MSDFTLNVLIAETESIAGKNLLFISFTQVWFELSGKFIDLDF